MPRKKTQSEPQTTQWLYKITRRGTTKLVKKKTEYNEDIDSGKDAKPVGYRFSKIAVKKGFTDDPYAKPTAEEIAKLKNKRIRSGGAKKLVVYSEKRKNKSDLKKGKK